jgi:hypothetical protein
MRVLPKKEDSHLHTFSMLARLGIVFVFGCTTKQEMPELETCIKVAYGEYTFESRLVVLKLDEAKESGFLGRQMAMETAARPNQDHEIL